MTDPTEQALIARADALNARIANCHTEVACPRCRAPVGERCRNMTRSYLRGRPIKHPHEARWTLVVAKR